jgi:hypothetical protein
MSTKARSGYSGLSQRLEGPALKKTAGTRVTPYYSPISETSAILGLVKTFEVDLRTKPFNGRALNPHPLAT